jgi:hypothetical protein
VHGFQAPPREHCEQEVQAGSGPVRGHHLDGPEVADLQTRSPRAPELAGSSVNCMPCANCLPRPPSVAPCPRAMSQPARTGLRPCLLGEAAVRRPRPAEPTADTDALIRGLVGKLEARSSAEADKMREAMRRAIGISRRRAEPEQLCTIPRPRANGLEPSGPLRVSGLEKARDNAAAESRCSSDRTPAPRLTAYRHP